MNAPIQLTARAAGALLTHEALLGAALEIFTEQTYAGAAVPMVAERAGIAVGTIYRHYPGKQALGNAVYQRWKGRLVERLSGYADEGSTRQAFGHLWNTLRDFSAEHPVAFAFLEHQQHAGYLDPENVALTERSTALATDMITRGQQRGEVRPGDPAVLVALAYGAFVGLAKAAFEGAVVTQADYAFAESAVWDLLRSP